MALGEAMESEIRSQPEVLTDASRRYFSAFKELIGDRQFDMVLIAARGSSDNAALFARYLIEIQLEIPVSLAAPSVFTRFNAKIRYPKCLALGISQSGAAPDVAEVLNRMRKQGHFTLAVTNTSDSRLEHEADGTLLLGVGKERAVAATKTYTASLLSMYELVRALGGKLDPPRLPDSKWVDRCQENAERSLGALLRSSTLFALARGYGFCTAEETALKLMECSLLSCKSYSTADFQHGPKALAGHGSCAVVYGLTPEGLDAQGCIVQQAPAFGDGPDAPISEIIYGQWLALLAARARGINPDDPRFLSKITMTL